ncbi:E3 ubiquitin-protein ligase TRIM62-like [Protopterus annectens]|uniref:E3 ubiquitin-protein ligase TRIM62-like n=1 Tax=Protopterus annectens TaxID=7888 RepID=UPI001CF9CB9D|nr:E3 ubiquitin-protein ligase TRIM62-like [Protopterus annectens]
MAGIIKPVNTFKDEIICSMCLQIFTYPVSLSCSHSFCLSCIQDHLKHKPATDKYSCPECRTMFDDKPRLLKNTELSDKVEQLSRNQGNGIYCDYCLEDAVPAVMSCIQCEAFFCMTHLRPHSEKVYLKEHLLVDVSEALCLRKCAEHKEILKLFCTEDHICICSLCCIVGQHKQHNVVTIEEAKTEVQTSLTERLRELNRKKNKAEDRIKHVRAVNSQMLSIYSSFHEKTVQQYKEIKAVIEEDEQQTLHFIEAAKQAALLYTENQTKQYAEELDDLKRVISQVSTVLNQSNALKFLKSASCNEYRIHLLLNKPDQAVHDTLVDEGVLSSIMKSVTKLFNSLTKQATTVRKALLSFATTVTLDPVTANENLLLSEDRTMVRYTDEPQKAPYSPKRFDDTLYVFGSEGFTFGRHYWEIVVKSKSDWEIGVAYTSMPRKGKSWLGRNPVSWSLECSNITYTAWHNNISIKLSCRSKIERVGVYLDYNGGIIAFYNAENIALLVSFRCKFTEPLYPVLNPCNCKGGNYAPLTVLQLKGIGSV